ncbi:MAG: hypothetical protein ACI9ES_000232 [Oceanospirillaceae bacterium]|jgi:hypothetical protein
MKSVIMRLAAIHINIYIRFIKPITRVFESIDKDLELEYKNEITEQI